MRFKIDDLWERMKANDTDLTENETKRIQLAGKALTGDTELDYRALYWFVDPPLTFDQQTEFDKAIRAFITDH